MRLNFRKVCPRREHLTQPRTKIWLSIFKEVQTHNNRTLTLWLSQRLARHPEITKGRNRVSTSKLNLLRMRDMQPLIAPFNREKYQISTKLARALTIQASKMPKSSHLEIKRSQLARFPSLLTKSNMPQGCLRSIRKGGTKT